jgi:hypothetical protein
VIQKANLRVAPPLAAPRTARGSVENWVILLMLACHATQLLPFFAGSTGQWIGTIGALAAIAVSLLSTKAMFLLLFGLNLVPLTNEILATMRVYVLVYFILAVRLAATPSAFASLLGKDPASAMLRRWYLVWLMFSAVLALFFLATADSAQGVSRAWDVVRGLGTAFLASILAITALKDVEDDRVWSFGVVTYALLGALWWQYVSDKYGADVMVEGRLSGKGGDPNALAMIVNIGIGMCIGVVLKSRSWLLRLYAVGAGLLAVTVVAMTGSRAGALATAAMVLSAMFINASRASTVVKQLLILGILVLVGASVVAPFVGETMLPRIQRAVDAIQSGNWEAATSERSMLLYVHWQRLVNSGFLGEGFDYRSLPSSRYDIVHNTWMQVLSDFGIVGFILFIALTWPIFSFVFRSVRFFSTARFGEDRGVAALGTGVAVVIVGMLVETNTLTAIFEISFWWCVGSAVAFEYRYRWLQRPDNGRAVSVSGRRRGISHGT